MELGSSGDVLQACRRGGIEVRRCGALEACCACRDVWEAERHGAREFLRCAASL